jgi:O-antigen/teichoic acid export membrane protein
MSGTVVAQTLGVLITPILTRLYTAEAFGESALFMSMASIIGVVACLKYELAIVIPKKDEQASLVVSVSFFVLVTVTILLGFCVTFVGDSIVRIFNKPALSSYIMWLPAMVFVLGINLIMNYWYSRKKKFGQNALSRITISLTTQGVKLGAGLFSMASGGAIIAANLFGQLAGGIYLASNLFKDTDKFKCVFSAVDIKQTALRYKKFPIFSSLSSLLNTASQQMPVLVMSYFFESSTVGYYAFGLGLLSMPMALIATSVSQVFYQKACELKLTGGKEISSHIFISLFGLGFFPFAFIALYGKLIFVVVFGENWVVAGSYAQLLCIWSLFMFIARPLSMSISVFELQQIGLILQIILFVLRIGSVIVGGIMNNPYLAVALFSVTGAVHCLMTSLWYVKTAGGNVKTVVRKALTIIASGSFMLGIHYLFYRNVTQNFVVFIIFLILVLSLYYLSIRHLIITKIK